MRFRWVLLTCFGPVIGLWSTSCAEDESKGFPRVPEVRTDAFCDTQNQAAPTVIHATAPVGAGKFHLGRPVDKDFQFFPGPEGRSVFVYDEPAPNTDEINPAFDPAIDPCKTGVKGVFCSTVNSLGHRTVAFEDSRSLSANLGVRFLFFSAGGGISTSNERRYATYEAYQLSHCLEVDDTAQVRQPPKEASYYIKRICFGRMYSTVLSGASSTFNAGVRAGFLFFSGSVETFSRTNNLEVTTRGIGLEPITGEAIFARTEEELRAHYRQAGEPSPIYIDYQALPDTCAPAAQLIEWKAPFNVIVELKQLRVHRYGRNPWFLKARAKLNGDTELFLANPNLMTGHTVGEGCESGPPDSRGDSNFCRYNLGWSTRIQPVAGDVVTFGVDGNAGQDRIPYNEFKIEVGATNENQCGTIGSSDGHVSYFLDYCVTFQAS